MTGTLKLTLPILYSFRRCPYAMRARLALTISEIACEVREIKLRAKPAEMLAASPKGTVPVLVLPDGRVIDESLDIMRWALGQNDPSNWLAGDDPELIARNDGPFKRHLDRYKYPVRYPASEIDGIDHRALAMEILADLDARLAVQPWLGGAEQGLADTAIFPFVRQFAAVEPDWFKQQALPHLHPWLARQLASPLFDAVMVRRDVWQSPEPSPSDS